jgi:hypothetical protein
VVGSCRWILPAGADEGLWPEAKVPRVSGKEKRLKEWYESADWEYDHALDVLDGLQLGIKERLVGAKNYLRQSLSRVSHPFTLPNLLRAVRGWRGIGKGGEEAD